MKLSNFTVSYGSHSELKQQGVIEANTQAVDKRTRKHLLREARKQNERRAMQLRRRR